MKAIKKFLYALRGARKSSKILLSAVLVVILGITLFPFDFTHFGRILHLPTYFEGIKFGGYSRCCVHLAIIEPLANVLLFMPYGFALVSMVSKSQISLRDRIGLILFFSMTFSFLIEFLQVFLPDRSPSLTDVLMNAIGGGAGVLLFLWIGPTVMKALGFLDYFVQQHRKGF